MNMNRGKTKRKKTAVLYKIKKPTTSSHPRRKHIRINDHSTAIKQEQQKQEGKHRAARAAVIHPMAIQAEISPYASLLPPNLWHKF